MHLASTKSAEVVCCVLFSYKNLLRITQQLLSCSLAFFSHRFITTKRRKRFKCKNGFHTFGGASEHAESWTLDSGLGTEPPRVGQVVEERINREKTYLSHCVTGTLGLFLIHLSRSYLGFLFSVVRSCTSCLHHRSELPSRAFFIFVSKFILAHLLYVVVLLFPGISRLHSPVLLFSWKSRAGVLLIAFFLVYDLIPHIFSSVAWFFDSVNVYLIAC